MQQNIKPLINSLGKKYIREEQNMKTVISKERLFWISKLQWLIRGVSSWNRLLLTPCSIWVDIFKNNKNCSLKFYLRYWLYSRYVFWIANFCCFASTFNACIASVTLFMDEPSYVLMCKHKLKRNGILYCVRTGGGGQRG